VHCELVFFRAPSTTNLTTLVVPTEYLHANTPSAQDSPPRRYITCLSEISTYELIILQSLKNTWYTLCEKISKNSHKRFPNGYVLLTSIKGNGQAISRRQETGTLSIYSPSQPTKYIRTVEISRQRMYSG